MKILVIGGTLFLGRHLVDAALAAGHEVTLFNRGKTNPDLYPDVTKLRGDRREGDLKALEGGEWDLAIDTCGYFPREVRAMTDVLEDRVGHYTFVSTISVYDDFSKPTDELSPVGVIDEPDTTEMSNEAYGPLKALCEQVAEDAMPGRVLVVRPGLIVGPHDPTDRYSYWPWRVAQGGEVLAPGPKDDVVQIIDGRDLAEWMVRAATRKLTGVFNATSEPFTFAEMVDGCREAAGSDAGEVTWVDPKWLLEHEVTPWMELPVWIPQGIGSDAMHRSSVDRAVAEGLTFRSPTVVARDTLDWLRTRPVADVQWQHTLEREKEVKLLEEWHSRA
jgi:2'-hydroxyisoflavone reductase